MADNAPLQPPEAVHAVALVELQVSVELEPPATLVGFASNVAVGVGGAGAVTTIMTVTAGLTPPGPVQVSEYDVLVVSDPLLRLPLVGNAPLQPPEALQEVASDELQVNVDALPLSIASGDALREALGGATTGDLLAPPPHAATKSAVLIAMTGANLRIASPFF